MFNHFKYSNIFLIQLSNMDQRTLYIVSVILLAGFSSSTSTLVKPGSWTYDLNGASTDRVTVRKVNHVINHQTADPVPVRQFSFGVLSDRSIVDYRYTVQ